MNIVHKLDPNNELIKDLLAYGIPEYKNMEVFEQMLRYDLQNVIKLIVSKKIRLILQSYPDGWPNKTLKQIAEINKIPFVDNEAIFKKLKSSDGYKKEDYFAEDGHCNTNGYRIVAENVYNLLVSLD